MSPTVGGPAAEPLTDPFELNLPDLFGGEEALEAGDSLVHSGPPIDEPDVVASPVAVGMAFGSCGNDAPDTTAPDDCDNDVPEDAAPETCGNDAPEATAPEICGNDAPEAFLCTWDLRQRCTLDLCT